MARRFRPWTKIYRSWHQSEKRRELSCDTARLLFIDACLEADQDDAYALSDLYVNAWLPTHQGGGRGFSRFVSRHAELEAVGLVSPLPDGRFHIVNGAQAGRPPAALQADPRQPTRQTPGRPPADPRQAKSRAGKDLTDIIPPKLSPRSRLDVEREGDKRTQAASAAVHSTKKQPDGNLRDRLWEAIKPHPLDAAYAKQIMAAAFKSLKNESWMDGEAAISTAGICARFAATDGGPQNVYAWFIQVGRAEYLRQRQDATDQEHKGNLANSPSLLAILSKGEP